MTWKIQAITSELTGQEIGIDRDMVVGRHQSADIVLQAAEISRKHAAFLLKDQALWVQDLNSSNGSFVNDLRIAQETLLAQGDIVQFANLKFLLSSNLHVRPPFSQEVLPALHRCNNTHICTMPSPGQLQDSNNAGLLSAEFY